MSPLAEEIATTLEILNDDAGKSQSVFKKIYLSFKFRFLRKYFIKISEKVRKRMFLNKKLLKTSKICFFGILPCVILISGKACCFLVIFFNLAI